MDTDEEPTNQPEPKRNGRPPFVPTQEQRQMVQILVANGVSQQIIAANIHRARGDKGIDVKTLEKHFRSELDSGYAQTEAAMGAALVNQGLKGNVAAQRYWLQTHGNDRWKVTDNIRHGLTPDTQNALGGMAPVLFIQPVRAVGVKSNGHDKHPDPYCVPLEDDATDATA